MKKAVLTLSEQIAELEKVVLAFIGFFLKERDFSKTVYTEWTAKDVLGHVASWHGSFAKNLLDAVHGIKPSPFKGSLTEVNEREVLLMSNYSIAELINKIRLSQELISMNIDNPDVQSIAYKKGSRDYSPVEHVEVVRRHVYSHLRDLEKLYAESC